MDLSIPQTSQTSFELIMLDEWNVAWRTPWTSLQPLNCVRRMKCALKLDALVQINCNHVSISTCVIDLVIDAYNLLPNIRGRRVNFPATPVFN